jgi:hypothetical protein
MAELRSGREAQIADRPAALREMAARGAEAAALYRSVGVPLVEGLAAFHRAAWADAVEAMLPVRVGPWQIGGSRAHCHVALALAHERLASCPRSAPNRCFLREAQGLCA